MQRSQLYLHDHVDKVLPKSDNYFPQQPWWQQIATNATTLNTNITPCNSSPQFSNPPVPYICQGQPYTFNQGAFDPENDSLSYSLGPCYNTLPNTLVTYAAGFSQNAPLGSSWNVSINPTTGDITVVPQPGNILTAGPLRVCWRMAKRCPHQHDRSRYSDDGHSLPQQEASSLTTPGYLQRDRRRCNKPLLGHHVPPEPR